MVAHVIATHKGEITGRRKTDVLTVDRSFLTASSAEADAVVVAGGAGLATNAAAITYVQMAYLHHKPLGCLGRRRRAAHARPVPGSRTRAW